MNIATRSVGSHFADVLSRSIRSENSAAGPAKVPHAGESLFEPVGTLHLVSENARKSQPVILLAMFCGRKRCAIGDTRQSNDATSWEHLCPYALG